MPATPDAPSSEQDVEWARLVEVAESWGIDPEPGAADVMWDDEPRTPAVASFLARQSQREVLLLEWEDAAVQVAKWQAVQTRILADALDLALAEGVSSPDTDLSVRAMAAELACAVGVSDRTVQAKMNDAQVIRDRFAATFTRLREGRMSRAHVQVIVEEGTRLVDDAVRGEYEQIVLELPGHLTTGRLRVAAKAIAEQLLPVSLTERHTDARSMRQVQVRDTEDGMAELWAVLPAVLAHGIHDRLTQYARTIRNAERHTAKTRAGEDDTATADAVAPGAANSSVAAGAIGGAESGIPHIAAAAHGMAAARVEGNGDAHAAVPADAADAASVAERTMDQLRADVLCDLLLTGHATTAGIDRDGGEGIDAIRGIVQITIPLPVLTGHDTAGSAFLAGKGPVDPDTARRIAGTATIWERVLTDPTTGAVLAVDRRFPTEPQLRHLRARDEHCRFPGCRIPVWRCDVDHTIDHHHGGPTSVCNLAHLCRRHHTMKHHTAWQVEQHPHGILQWTSPLGRSYTDIPPPTLRFIPERT